ncbi:chemotaxis response regulator protein-glutamate methylesterase [Glaciimonas sp. Gout2]|uniref:protein-glutamate methylesterase/protein-glutamine glutaminase n=2 Tax=Glaciimonas TaxID=1229970 RepID=UPI002AB56E3A|nr:MULTISPECIES: chemotaxis response regulator protein-glutamate methylesterase [unclassified Glaciimonas]MDY7548749.1 chemotaxis response regulator protein-glutamate methylesterase [Glaciimonas sp. CA11.2]MEB0013910.1 chemotaxis response regulator protein-glutamate methylesterase [Glaciimonas sp. Cout2]MEB0083845.1 chemotaxis response regulator protein-glutamate methylesterase [Glaciimonas sp. Gout2]
MANKIKVICVDDSALMRCLISKIINSQPDMTVIATAPDPLVARELIKLLNPDVLTLDVQMPRMDGLDFLEKLMRLRPMPVVMVSSLTEQGSETTLRALELGAVDFVPKPRLGASDDLVEYTNLVADKIRTASRARLQIRRTLVRREKNEINVAPPPLACVSLLNAEKIIVIGASTGGTEAIREILQPMPPECPGILIAQHMPPGFTQSFAQRLNGLCRITVKEAVHGEPILPGHAYIAPGGYHLSIARMGAQYLLQVDQEPPVNRHRPSIDVLFDSAAKAVGKNAIGIILTGMGRDGAAGLLRLRQAGAYTFAQDEASCVVFGMPREAIAIGAATEVVSMSEMSQRVFTRFTVLSERTRRF